MNKTRFVLTLWAGVGSVAAAGAANPPNVLIVVADDLSAYDVARYGVSSDPVHMPVLDRLADRGVTFTNAWSNPVCSPTRACIQTGRHSFRTGVGFLVLPNTQPLDPSEWILPELLGQATPQAYRSGAFGKWHLGNQTVGGFSAPNRAGYDVFAGNMTSLVDNQETYSAWMKVTNGTPKPAQKYNTTDIVDDAIRWLSSAPEPWFCYVAFNAPHVPLHAPPAHLHSVDLTSVPPPAFAPRPYFKAMVEAMDTEMGRLVASLGDRVDHTNIVFIGDNGSPKEAVVPPVLPQQAKISFYEAGIRVPLVVAGPAVRVKGSTSEALVHAVDVFPTVAEMAGVDPVAVLPPGTKIDGRSLGPYLRQPTLPSERKINFSELFGVTPLGQEQFLGYAVRDERYKLIYYRAATAGVKTELFDLWNDPNEAVDLLSGVPTPQIAATRDRLFRAADAIRGS